MDDIPALTKLFLVNALRAIFFLRFFFLMLKSYGLK
jgi:hypothetical protein